MTPGPRPHGSASQGASVGDPDGGSGGESSGSSGGATDTAADAVVRVRMKKAPSAFRTISEVADDLHIPQHVLRFWETKFPQVRPLKRGGGRRYYRPDDIALLRRISDLLYIQGFTIKGVQRLLRESGGRLSDHIPPPRGDERQEPVFPLEATRNPELPLPGLGPGLAGIGHPPRPHQPAQALTIARSGDGPVSRGPTGQGATGQGATGHGATGQGAEDEVVWLRRLLSEALAELEALRALLP